MIRVFTTYYRDSSDERHKEYLLALEKNNDLQLIDEIIILHESKDILPVASDKIKSVFIDKRPTFQLFFDVINNLTNPDDINIICNTDIYFNNTIRLSEKCNKNEVFALNRWDITNDSIVCLFPKYTSSDVWVFRGSVNLKYIDYYLGQLGCDNKLLYDLTQNNYKISNPSLSIKTFHLHQTNIRGFLSNPKSGNRVPSPYLYSIPHFINFRDFFNQLIKFGPIYILKLFIIQKGIRFQYYYDLRNNLIEHEHEIKDVHPYKAWKYWLLHDFHLPWTKLNNFKRSKMEDQ